MLTKTSVAEPESVKHCAVGRHEVGTGGFTPPWAQFDVVVRRRLATAIATPISRVLH